MPNSNDSPNGLNNGSRIGYSAALVAILLLANLIPALFSESVNRLKYVDNSVWSWKISLLKGGGLRGTEILILGDSQSQSGILPALLSEKGDAVYNMSLPAMQPEGLESLAHLMKIHAPGVRSVIVNISPYNAFSSDVYNGFLNYYRSELLVHDPVALFRGRADLAGKSVGDYLERGLMFLPLYSLHDVLSTPTSFGGNLSDFPFSAIRKNPGMISENGYRGFLLNYRGPTEALRRRYDENRRIEDQMASHRGYWIWKTQGSQVGECADGETTGIDGFFEYRDRRGSLESWRRALRTLSEGGREVILVQIPLSSYWEKTTDPEQVYGRLNRFIEEAMRGLNVRLIGKPDLRNYQGLFHDWTHLNYCGAKRYTLWLRENLGKDNGTGALLKNTNH